MNDFRNFAEGLNSLTNTGIKVGGAIFAGTAGAKFLKKKGRAADAIEQDQIELKKLEIEVQKAKLEAEKHNIQQQYQQPQQYFFEAKEPINVQPNLPEQTSLNSQEKLIKTYELLKAGVITEEEYAAIKKQVLGL
ncbi:MAG: hypothetical protein ACRDAW_01645 [Metamycoplasmataceae bacterium]